MILPHAAAIVNSYSTGVTLRQLFYRLVADGTIQNSQGEYIELARATAKARVEGTFPDLIDTRHAIHRPSFWSGPKAALQALIDQYRDDRTKGQAYSIYIGVEKAGLAEQLKAAFGDRGIPVLPLGGWASTPYVQMVQRDIDKQGRDAVFIYAGDLDPSGAYIGDDFVNRVARFDHVIRVATNVDQLGGLVANPTPDKVKDDPRAKAFVAEFGPSLRALGFDELVQFEVDSFDPDDLIDLYEDELRNWWVERAYRAALTKEKKGAKVLTNLMGNLP